MIRILQVVTRLNIGGPAHHVQLLATALDRRHFRTLIVAGRPSSEEGDLTAELKRAAHVLIVPELVRPLSPWRDLVAWWRLLVICARFEPDIVHTHMAKAGAVGRAAAWCANWLQRGRGRRRSQLIHTFHGHVLSGYFHPAAARVFIWCEQRLARGSSCLIAINRDVCQALRLRRIGRPDRIALIPLGLHEDRLLSADGHPAVADGHDGVRTAWRIGIVGRLVPIKHHPLLFSGLARLQAMAPEVPWRLSVVGDGVLRPELERLAAELGMAQRVQFCGWQLHPGEIYSKLDMVCLTSRNEGTPVALIEALAATKPVVATDVGGVGELLGGSCPAEVPFIVAERGVVVRPDDPDALAQALSWAWTHGPEHHRTAEAGHRYVQAQFSARRFATDHETLYRKLMMSEEQSCTHL